MGEFFSLVGVAGTLRDVTAVVNTITNTVLAFCAMLVVLFAVYIGFKFAKAQDDQARKNAKAQLIYSIIGLVVIGIIVTLVNVIGTISPETGNIGADIQPMYDNIRLGVEAVLNILVALGTLFGLYIGWQFMKADSDDKRKQAKAQLLYTAIGVIAIVVLNAGAAAVLHGLSRS